MDLQDILAIIGGANLGRATLVDDIAAAEYVLDEAYACNKRLAVYGTLAPGGPNHHLLAGCDGTWQAAAVPGRRGEREYPVFSYDAQAPLVPVQLLTSGDLEQHWPRLDAFEGSAYRRILVPVFQDQHLLTVANLYEAVTPV